MSRIVDGNMAFARVSFFRKEVFGTPYTIRRSLPSAKNLKRNKHILCDTDNRSSFLSLNINIIVQLLAGNSKGSEMYLDLADNSKVCQMYTHFHVYMHIYIEQT